MFADTFKYCWGVTFCQYQSDSHTLGYFKPITFISGRFSGTKFNYAALVREAFAICMLVKRLSLYLQVAECTILCDHKPLEKFLKGKT